MTIFKNIFFKDKSLGLEPPARATQMPINKPPKKNLIPVYITGFWTSFLAFFFQIYFPKVFSFLLSGPFPVTFSLCFALLGFGLGAYLILFKDWAQKVYMFFIFIPLSMLFCGGLISVAVNLYVLSFCAGLIFIPLGAVLTAGFKTADSYFFYIIDFTGAVLGVALALILMPHILFETIFIALICLTVVLSFLLFKKSLFFSLVMYTGLAGVSGTSLYLQLKENKFNLIKYSADIPLPRANLNGFRALKAGNHKLLHSKWSYTKRVDVVQSPEEIRLYYDNYYYTDVHNASEEKDPFYNFLLLFKDKKKVLSIGPGGGAELAYSLDPSGRKIKGIEMNNSVISLMQNELAEHSGHIYKKAQVLNREARRFLNETRETFDLITYIYADYPTAVTSRDLLRKDFFRTREGLKTAIDRLTPTGMFIYFSRLYFLDISVFNMIVNLSDATKDLGLDLKNHIAVIKRKREGFDIPNGLLILKKSPFTEKERQKLQNFAQSHKEYLEVFMGEMSDARTKPVTESLTKPLTESLDEREKLLRKIILSQDKTNLLASLHNQKIILYKPPQDKQPFLNYFYEKNKLVKSLILVFAVTLTLFFVNFLFYRRFIKNSPPPKSSLRVLQLSILLSAGAGLFYGTAEALFIELLSLSFHNPVFLMGTVFCGLLLGSIISAFISRKLTPAGAVYGLAFLAFYLPPVLWVCQQEVSWREVFYQEPWNYILVFMLMSFISGAGSLIFPKVLALIQKKLKPAIPLVYGVNVLTTCFGFFLTVSLYFFAGLKIASVALYLIYLILLLVALFWLKAIKTEKDF